MSPQYRCVSSCLASCLWLFFACTVVVHAQVIRPLTGGSSCSIRGLSVVNDHVIWVSGSGGRVGRSVNGGASWEWSTVKGFEKRDFRDIEAFNDSTAIILAVAEPGNILKTTDGGRSWRTVFTDPAKGMFLDAMDFDGMGYGVAVGDPLDSLRPRAYCIYTTDDGENWHTAPYRFPLQKGEAMFASSGTNVVLRKKHPYLVTGGTASHIFSPAGKHLLPLLQGGQTTGANSVAMWNNDQLVVVGGDFLHDRDTTKNCALTRNGGQTWIIPPAAPHGYRSCVIYASASKLVSCGTSGVDVSDDGGLHWKLVSTEGYHVCGKAKQGTAIFLAGSGGRIAKLEW